MTQLELTGRTLAGRYRVEKQLGAGGMGAVYLAVQQPLERKVALKVLHPSLTESADAEQRFAREAQSSSHLSHPHIVAVHDFGVDDGLHYLVMELVDGESLLDVLARERVLSVERATRIIAGVCDALTFAHEHGVIHRDIKPANVMLLTTPTDFVKVLDFGIAKVRGWETLTADGAILGTPGYVPPELFEPDGKPSTSSDLYAVGVMLFEMLTGRQPFLGDTPMQLIKQAVMNDPPRPSELADVPAPVEALMLELLAKTPEGRPPSAAAVKARLLEAARVSTSDLKTEQLERAPEIETVHEVTRPPPSTPLPLAAKVVLGLGALGTLALMFAGWQYGWSLAEADHRGCNPLDLKQCMAMCDEGSAPSCAALENMELQMAMVPSEYEALCKRGNEAACAQYKRVTMSRTPDDNPGVGLLIDGKVVKLDPKKISVGPVKKPSPRLDALQAGASGPGRVAWSQSFATGKSDAKLSILSSAAAGGLVKQLKSGLRVEIVGGWAATETEAIGAARARWMRDQLLARGAPASSIVATRTRSGVLPQASAQVVE